jgi:hypothetical protein
VCLQNRLAIQVLNSVGAIQSVDRRNAPGNDSALLTTASQARHAPRLAPYVDAPAAGDSSSLGNLSGFLNSPSSLNFLNSFFLRPQPSHRVVSELNLVD